MTDAFIELANEAYAKLSDLSKAGEALFDMGDYPAAIKKWQEALTLLPEPKNQWEAAMWLYTALGDAHRCSGRLEEALTYFQSAFGSAEGYKNPFILLSLGVTLYDLDRKDEAIDPLVKAYMLQGPEIFEDNDVIYLEFLKKQGRIK